MSNKPFIGIAGNIGVGKTTFTSFVAKEFNLVDIYESVSDNPYLSDFYSDMKRWSFNLQIYFLHHRFASINNMVINSNRGIVQDRTIYEDVSIFAYNLYKMGIMSKRDWRTYKNLFNDMIQFIKEPDLIIYLKASTTTLISRIKNRQRNFEKNISIEYIHSLNIYYDQWISKLPKGKVMIIDTNDFNIFKDIERFSEIKSNIINKLKMQC